MIDIVYPWKRSGTWELSRSIMFANLNIEHRLIFVIGDDPKMGSGVVHIGYVDKSDPNTNIIHKALAACDNPMISDPFLLMSDDHFVLKPVAEWPFAQRGNMKVSRGPYGKILANTIAECQKRGLPILNYDCHRPMLIHKAPYKASYAGVKACVPKSLYGNTVGGGVACVDAKKIVRGMAEPYNYSEHTFISSMSNPRRAFVLAIDKLLGIDPEAKAEVVKRVKTFHLVRKHLTKTAEECSVE